MTGVGILAMEIYIPKRYVSQEELEVFDGVSAGKYTIGLGQKHMSFCGDREDTASLALSAVALLMEKNNIAWNNVGRIDVGTESLIDKSKPIKTYLMSLFGEHGNHSIEGVDSMAGCYGGTAALFNCINWVESSSWDGRLAIVVTADIAIYAAKNARPTGGSGAVAVLVGPQAPLLKEGKLSSTFMDHIFDFYKPNLGEEWPLVNGALSLQSYLHALVQCYITFKAKYLQTTGEELNVRVGSTYFCFHAPYGKLVRKAFARLYAHDVGFEGEWTKEIETSMVEASHELFCEKVKPSMMISNEMGNIYCGSLFAGVMSRLSNHEALEENTRLICFSYGSGCSSSMFSLKWSGTQALSAFKVAWDLPARLQGRQRVRPDHFEAIQALRSDVYSRPNWNPREDTDTVPDGAFYLAKVDAQFQRFHQRRDGTS
jgi:hydroxymethylglutaryl-CoA synthase